MTTTDETTAPSRVSSLQRVAEAQFANPLFRVLLRSRFHWLVSNWLVLVSYVGRRTGRRFTFPVAYHRRDGTVVAVTPKRESNWWRNFHDPRPCQVWLRGSEHDATGERITGEERDSLVVEYFETHGLLGYVLGVGDDIATAPDALARVQREFAVVRFTLDDRRETAVECLTRRR